MDNEATPSKLTKHIVVSADSFVVVLATPGDDIEAGGVTPSDQSDAPWENVTWAASGGPIIGPTLTIIMPQDDDEDERIDTS
jgi:hypothetical protein